MPTISLQTTGLVLLTCLLGSACASDPIPKQQEITPTITTATTDGVTIFGERYFGTLDSSAPLVLLFHQGGSNGRGEYAEIADWLNGAGFRAIAWDQRAGGDTYGEANRTVLGLPDGVATGYCDAYPDLVAALEYVLAEELAGEVVLWGSSYSAALIFKLAAEYPEKVAGLLAFSPASGGPLETCRARIWIDEINAPVSIFRPAAEMERAPSVEQKDILTAAGANFVVIENGIHGSSMLLDSRTEQDMHSARESVLSWLRDVTGDDSN